MASTVKKDDSMKSLNDELQNCVEVVSEIETSAESSTSENLQALILLTISKLEELTRRISELSCFSSNESVEEVSTSSLRFLLLPALLGYLTEKSMKRDRKEMLDITEIYLKDFLNRLISYEVVAMNVWWMKVDDNESGESTSSKTTSSTVPIASRDEKIRQYRIMEVLKQEREALKESVKLPSCDEETIRQFYLTELKIWANIAEDLLRSVQQEKPFVDRMEKIKSGDLREPARSVAPTEPLKPIIITRNANQKRVFGLGYPSLPTMSIEEFFEQKRAEGQVRVVEGHEEHNIGQQGPMTEEDEKVLKETAAERENPDLIRAERQDDEYHDSHRRGWGNVHNKG